MDSPRHNSLIRSYLAQQQTSPVSTISNTRITSLSTQPEQIDSLQQSSSLTKNINITPLPLTIHTVPEDGSLSEESVSDTSEQKSRQKALLRTAATILAIILICAIYLLWQPVPSQSPSSPLVQYQSTVVAPNSTAQQTINSSISTTIQVYVVGAVHKPGVYKLPADARVHDALKAAGGTLSTANLVAINLAARLYDGQEIYVTRLGERPPTYVGGVPSSTSGTNTTLEGNLININTASESEMREHLNVSSQTAKSIIQYREQHGPYISVGDLLKVVSKSIYDKIKDRVTV